MRVGRRRKGRTGESEEEGKSGGVGGGLYAGGRG